MKVKCKDCKHESERVCVLKNIKINSGKKRKCDDYEKDSVRELIRLKRADAINRKFQERQQAIREFFAGQKASKELSGKHPLTGDLSRFK